MIPEMPVLIPIQNLSHGMNMQADLNRTPAMTQKVGSQILTSDNDKKVDNQILLVKRIR